MEFIGENPPDREHIYELEDPKTNETKNIVAENKQNDARYRD